MHVVNHGLQIVTQFTLSATRVHIPTLFRHTRLCVAISGALTTEGPNLL